MDSLLEHYKNEYKQHRALLQEAYREQALNQFLETGFPTRKSEAWRYTKLDNLLKVPFHLSFAEPVGITQESIKPFCLEDEWLCVFVNGHFCASLSTITDSPCILNDSYMAYKKRESNSFHSLNAAFSDQGFFVMVPANIHLAKPIHFLHITTEQDLASMSHVYKNVVVEESARADLVESYIGLTAQPYFMNCATDLFLRKDAQANMLYCQDETKDAFHISQLEVVQDERSQFDLTALAVGAELGRLNTHIHIGESASSECRHGFYARNKQTLDFHVDINHFATQGKSNTLIKGIADDKGHGVVNGKIYVAEHAQKIDSALNSHNLLLSDGAEIDTKPELEVYANDVLCSHGATVGDIDEDALFYLQSRGVAREDAFKLLLAGFIEEIIPLHMNKMMRRHLQALIKRSVGDE